MPAFRERAPSGNGGADRLEVQNHQPAVSLSPARRWIIGLVALAAISITLNVWLWSRHTVTGTPATTSPSANFITILFGHSSKPMHIVVTDSALVLMQSLARRRFNLGEYTNHSYLQFPVTLSKTHGIRPFWDFLASRQLLNLGDMSIVNRILQSLPAHRQGVGISDARDMNTRDFKTGNFILLGNAYSNPWVRLFSVRRLTFQFTGDVSGGPPGIRDLDPRRGEKEVYVPEVSQGLLTVSYARVVLVPNLTGTGRVLMIAGLGMESTEAAADFLLDPASTHSLLGVLGIHTTGSLPNLEMLLETSSVGGGPVSARLVAYRIDRPHLRRELAKLSPSK